MPNEIERKFLVCGDFRSDVSQSRRIVQGYLSSVPERSVRVRLYNSHGLITVKGISNTSGTSRYEWEHEISAKDARELLELCEPGVIVKTRHNVIVADHVIEVDEFDGDNAGLVVAEIELKSEDELFEKPEWLGAEVTGDLRYYNLMLAKEPFRTWSQTD